MCKFINLVTNEFGQVQRCHSCKCYHISFYTTYIVLSDNNFDTFLELIDEKISYYGNIDCERLPERCINIPSPVPGFGFLLTVWEAQDLYKMLDLAKSELIFRNLMQLFERE